MTDGTPKVYESISKVMLELSKEGIEKSQKNTQQGYKYRGIDDVYNSLSRLMPKHSLVILPRVISRDVSERQTSKGGVIFYVTIVCDFDFVCAVDGSIHTVRTFGEAMDSADKATNKAMSAAYKYACLQAFCIPTEGDNDADATTHEVVPSSSEKNNDLKPRTVSHEEAKKIESACTECGKDSAVFAKHYKVEKLTDIPEDRISSIWNSINKAREEAIRPATKGDIDLIISMCQEVSMSVPSIQDAIGLPVTGSLEGLTKAQFHSMRKALENV